MYVSCSLWCWCLGTTQPLSSQTCASIIWSPVTSLRLSLSVTVAQGMSSQRKKVTAASFILTHSDVGKGTCNRGRRAPDRNPSRRVLSGAKEERHDQEG